MVGTIAVSFLPYHTVAMWNGRHDALATTVEEGTQSRSRLPICTKKTRLQLKSDDFGVCSLIS